MNERVPRRRNQVLGVDVGYPLTEEIRLEIFGSPDFAVSP